MSPQSLENTLRSLWRHGTLVKDRPYRQVWRFEHDGRAYFLKFYPRGGVGDRLRRLFRGSPAMAEFLRLQWLQKARVPAPRGVATLMGFRLNDRMGDALILEAIEPAVPLDRHLNAARLEGRILPDHRALVEQAIALIERLGRGGLGHRDLHPGNFLLSEGKLYLLDAYAVRRSGLRVRDVVFLGQSARPFVHNSDLLRGWKRLSPGQPFPRAARHNRPGLRKQLSRIRGENRYFGRLAAAGWSGHFFKHAKYPVRWSAVSRMDIARRDWLEAWPILLGQIQSGQLEIVKQSSGGQVLAGEVVLAGRPVPVIVKLAGGKSWRRCISDLVLGSRAARGWRSAWALVFRDIPTAWPMLVMQRRVAGYPVESLIVFERVAGRNLACEDLAALPDAARRTLFHRLGRTLRHIEETGLVQYDPKCHNWIVHHDPVLGPLPVLVDVDGIRRWRPLLLGQSHDRLRRAVASHRHYRPQDWADVCLGHPGVDRRIAKKGPP